MRFIIENKQIANLKGRNGMQKKLTQSKRIQIKLTYNVGITYNVIKIKNNVLTRIIFILNVLPGGILFIKNYS